LALDFLPLVFFRVVFAFDTLAAFGIFSLLTDTRGSTTLSFGAVIKVLSVSVSSVLLASVLLMVE
jgi:hypothetical protein